MATRGRSRNVNTRRCAPGSDTAESRSNRLQYKEEDCTSAFRLWHRSKTNTTSTRFVSDRNFVNIIAAWLVQNKGFSDHCPKGVPDFSAVMQARACPSGTCFCRVAFWRTDVHTVGNGGSSRSDVDMVARLRLARVGCLFWALQKKNKHVHASELPRRPECPEICCGYLKRGSAVDDGFTMSPCDCGRELRLLSDMSSAQPCQTVVVVVVVVHQLSRVRLNMCQTLSLHTGNFTAELRFQLITTPYLWCSTFITHLNCFYGFHDQACFLFFRRFFLSSVVLSIAA